MSPTKVLTEVIREWSEVFMHRSMRDFQKIHGHDGSIILPDQHPDAPGPSTEIPASLKSVNNWE